MSVSVNCKRASGGFTLIELVLVVAMVVFLMGVFLNRFQNYQEQAEKVAMEGLASGLQSALTLQYGQLLTRGQLSDEAALLQDNPINWLQKRPRNYAGEFFDPRVSSVEPGNWLFDLHTRQLIYIPLKVTHFKAGSDGQAWIRFHVVTQHEASRLPSLQKQKPELTGALFEPVEPYSWF